MKYNERMATGTRRIASYTLSEEAREAIRLLSAREGVSASSIVERLILEAGGQDPRPDRDLQESACEAV